MNSLAKLLKWLALLFVVIPLGLIAVTALLGPSNQKANGAHSPPSVGSDARHRVDEKHLAPRDSSRDQANVLSNVDVKFTWKKGGFDTLAIVDFKIDNRNPFALRDLVVECTSFGKSGTKVSSNKKVIYEVFPAGKVTTIKEFSMGFIHSQSDGYSCDAIGAAEHRG